MCLSKKTMEMMFVSQDLRDITLAASWFGLSLRHCMAGRRCHCEAVGLENPLSIIYPGLYQGQEDKAEEGA